MGADMYFSICILESLGNDSDGMGRSSLLGYGWMVLIKFSFVPDKGPEEI